MFEIRVHGRGGQGVVTAAELLSIAAFIDGRHAMAFPSFGSERTGAPIAAFCRIDGRPIRVREPVVAPDALIIQDPTLLRQPSVFDGAGPDSYLLINSAAGLAALALPEPFARPRPGRALTVPATRIAVARLGRPAPNTALLGAFAALTEQVSIEAIADAIRQRFTGDLAAANVAAARDAHTLVRSQLEELAHAQAS